MLLNTGDKLVMIGDSVTDVERAQPVGEGLFGAIGKGYVAMVDALLATAYPDRRLRVVNMGNSGNTVRDLKTRWQRDVLDLHPDWLSIMIGINDVWRQFDMPLQMETHVPLAEYEATLDELVAQSLPHLKGLVLLTPYYIEPNAGDLMRARMDEYGAAVKRVATRRQTLLVDTQAAFNAFLQHYHSSYLAWDRVHPTPVGHMLLARTFLHAIGYQWQGEV